VTDPPTSPGFLDVSSATASRYDEEIGEILRDIFAIHSEFIALFLNAALKR
jgi:hypothetical protein